MNIPSTDSRIHWSGRVFRDGNNDISLISSGSSLGFKMKGNRGRIWLRDGSAEGEYNYISFDVNGKHFTRKIIRNKEFESIEIPAIDTLAMNEIVLNKETEASCGPIIISHLEVEDLVETEPSTKLKIEFIGNSITAGMASDPSLIPCETNKWYDQHNAYMAYGPQTARILQMEYMVVAISGIGAYRNWSTDYPVMGDVYEHTFLTDVNSDPIWDFEKFIPDIVCINLGTNDLSDGDGISQRAAFDSTRFIENYVGLITKVYEKYRSPQFILLQLQWPGQSYKSILTSCLSTIKNQAESKLQPGRPILHFTFSPLIPTGCTGHPGLAEHAQMANELAAFIQKEILAKN